MEVALFVGSAVVLGIAGWLLIAGEEGDLPDEPPTLNTRGHD